MNHVVKPVSGTNMKYPHSADHYLEIWKIYKQQQCENFVFIYLFCRFSDIMKVKIKSKCSLLSRYNKYRININRLSETQVMLIFNG